MLDGGTLKPPKTELNWEFLELKVRLVPVGINTVGEDYFRYILLLLRTLYEKYKDAFTSLSFLLLLKIEELPAGTATTTHVSLFSY